MNYADVKDGVYYWVKPKYSGTWYVGMREKEGWSKIWKMADNYIMEDDFQKEWEVLKEIPSPDEINKLYEIQTHSDITGDGFFPCVKDAIDQMQTDKSIRTLTIGVESIYKENLLLVRKSSGDLVLEQVSKESKREDKRG